MTWHEYPTNFSNGTTVDSASSFFMKYPSFILNDFFATGILIIIFVFSFILSMVVGSKKALLTSSFISFVFSVFFVRLDLVNVVVPIIFIVLMIIGMIGSKQGGNY